MKRWSEEAAGAPIVVESQDGNGDGEVAKTVREKSPITPYPKRGELDEWKPGMDDEATADPDCVPYLPNADDEPA